MLVHILPILLALHLHVYVVLMEGLKVWLMIRYNFRTCRIKSRCTAAHVISWIIEVGEYSGRTRTVYYMAAGHQLCLSGHWICDTNAIGGCSVLGKLLVHLFYSFHVCTTCHSMVYHWHRIVLADYTFCGTLDTFGSIPGLVNVAGWKVLQIKK